MNALTKNESYDLLAQLICDYTEATKIPRVARICFSALAGSSEFISEEKVRWCIAKLVRNAGCWEMAFKELSSLPCFLPSDLEKLRVWVRSKKGGAL